MTGKIVDFEQFPPNMVHNVLAAKLFCLRLISDVMLVYELYRCVRMRLPIPAAART